MGRGAHSSAAGGRPVKQTKRNFEFRVGVRGAPLLSPEGTKESRRDHVLLSSLTGLDGGGVCSQR